MDYIADVGALRVNLKPALPLLLRDWLALQELGVTMETMSKATLPVMHALAKYVITKARPDVPDEAILNMTMTQLKKVFTSVAESEEEDVDRPSSTSSTS